MCLLEHQAITVFTVACAT